MRGWEERGSFLFALSTVTWTHSAGAEISTQRHDRKRNWRSLTRKPIRPSRTRRRAVAATVAHATPKSCTKRCTSLHGLARFGTLCYCLGTLKGLIVLGFFNIGVSIKELVGGRFQSSCGLSALILFFNPLAGACMCLA